MGCDGGDSFGKLVAEVEIEPGTACHSGYKAGVHSHVSATGCELSGEYSEQSGAVTDSFYLMTRALRRCRFVYWICSLCFSLARSCALHANLEDRKAGSCLFINLCLIKMTTRYVLWP